MSSKSNLELLPLGGMGKVTQNMYLYMYGDEMLIVDCGIGFPDQHMPGVDVLIPDVKYLMKQLKAGKEIVGMVLSHGHDDHIAATGYLLGDLPEFPIYASPLTAGFAENRMKDGGVKRTINILKDGQVVEIGQSFRVESLAVTHSVPDTKHLLISTPVGLIYHGTDFKLDDNPVDGVKTDKVRVERAGRDGILCMLIDCLRVERSERVPSESTTGPVIEQAMTGIKGKCIVTLMSSHLHRLQQTIDAAQRLGRKVAFVGRSVEQNVEIAVELGKLNLPKNIKVDKRDIGDYPDERLCLIVAGSQGQEGSSLVRAVSGDHPVVQISEKDVVIFSADAIPGNEINYFSAIDELSRKGVKVVYPDIAPGLHQSGHASAPEQQEMVELANPKYVMPIGGADRHRTLFVERVAEPAGISPERVLIPGKGDVLSFDQNGRVRVSDHITITPQAVDGLGVGDVGPRVLSDRKALGEAGIIMVIMPEISKGQFDLKNIQVVSRGFVFMKEAEDVIKFIKDQTVETIGSFKKKTDNETLRKAIESRLSRRLFKIIRREPIIVPVFFPLAKPYKK